MKCPYCGRKLRRTSSGWLMCDNCKVHLAEPVWVKRIKKMEDKMKYQLEDKVKYIGVSVRKKHILGCVGVIVATKENNDLGVKLRKDEYLVDFGTEDDCVEVVREPQLIKEAQNE